MLQQRLREGKVYVPEQAGRAIERFFRKGNLIALREPALRRTAERVDAQMRGYMAEQGIRETWATGERLLVCIGPSPEAVKLVRATRRMAARVHAEWVAVHVETPRDQRLSAAEREDIVRGLELAEQLGGRAVTLSGASAADEILAYAREHNVTRIVTGKTRRPRWRELLQGSLLESLVRRSGDIQVLAISGAEEDEGKARSSPPPAPRRSTAREYLAAAAIVVVPTVIGLAVRRIGVIVPPIDAAMLYLLAVVVAAARFRRGPGAHGIARGNCLVRLFLRAPVLHLLGGRCPLRPHLRRDAGGGAGDGNLTGRIRNQAEAAREREQRTSALYALSRDLATAQDQDAVVAAALRSLRDTFALDGVILLPDDAEAVRATGPAPYALEERERAVAQWSFDHAQAAGRGTTTLPAARALYLPLATSGRTVGVLGVPLGDPADFRNPARRRLFEALAGQAAVALERLALAERSRESQVEIEAERLRTALLSSLSHDMRTPLASIEGAASTLLQEAEPDRGARRELAATIVQESHRMGRLVANLLDMIRVESGTLQVQKEWQLLPDVVGVALLRTEEQVRDRAVTTHFPPELPLVPMDEILLEQVFVNLLENAAKHTPAGTPIEVGAEARPTRSHRLRGRSRPGPARRRGGPRVPEVLPRRLGQRRDRARAHDLPRHRHRARRPDVGRTPPGWRDHLQALTPDHRHPPAARRRGRMDRPAPLILLIEDEPQMRRFLRTALTAHDYRLVEAETAKEGLAQATARNPDVVLLDLGLPDRDGLEVTRELRGWSATPIIVLSARGREQDKVAALDIGRRRLSHQAVRGGRAARPDSRGAAPRGDAGRARRPRPCSRREICGST